MADFRRSIFAFIVVGLLLSFSTAVYAQGSAFTCTANAGVPPILRSEGLTELMGDIVINCTGGTPTASGTTIPTANFTIFVNTQVTSRILAQSGGLNISESILTIDEPGAPSTGIPQNLCGSVNGCNVPGRGGVANPFVAGANVYQGVVSGNTVSFIGVPVEPPGSTGTTVYRITNVRVNANGISSSTLIPGQVSAAVSISGTTSLPLTNPSVVTGFVQPGLNVQLRNAANNNPTGAINLLQCNGANTGGNPQKSPNAFLRFGEGFPTAWKPQFGTQASGSAGQFQPGVIYNSESGLILPTSVTVINSGANGAPATVVATGGDQIGVADTATRFKATFNNIPAGVSIFVPTVLTGAQTTATMTLSETLPFVAVTSTATFGGNVPVAQVALSNGAGSVVWEVTAVGPNYAVTSDNLDAAIYFQFGGGSATVGGPGTVTGSFAPTYDTSVTPAAGRAALLSTFPIPRFVPGTPLNLINIVICRTYLLFPYLASVSGFDTGISIANTTTDIFGTTPQAGTCQLNFFGKGAPSAITTESVASGAIVTRLGSTDFPNFQGYMIAQCNFQFAHGFAAISDLGARNWVTVYLALIIDGDSPRLSGLPAATPAEALNN